MTYMTKAQVRQHIVDAPMGSDPLQVIRSLRANGVQMEGDPLAPSVQPKQDVGLFGQSITPTPYAQTHDLKTPDIGIRSAIENRGNTIAQLGEDLGAGKQGIGSTILQTTGELAGGVNDVAAAPVKAITSPIQGIFESWATAHPEAASALGDAGKFIKQSFVQAATGVDPAIQDLLSQSFHAAASQIAAAHPEAAKNLAAIGEIAKFAGTVAGAEQLGTQAGLGKNIDLAAVKDANAYAQGAFTDPSTLPAAKPSGANAMPETSVMPRATAAMKESKLMKGEVKPGGFFKADTYLPSDSEKTIYQTVKSVEGFSPKNSATKNAIALVEGVAKEGDKLGTELQSFDKVQKIGLSPEQYKSTVQSGVNSYVGEALNKEGSIFPKESVTQQQFNEIKNIWDQTIEQNPPSNLSDVWKNNLQKFDRRLEEVYGSKIFNGTTDAPRAAAVRAVRRAAQQFIQDTAEQAGVDFKPQITRMSHMYRALENVADSAAHAPGSGFGRAMKTPAGKVVKAIAKPLGVGEAVGILHH